LIDRDPAPIAILLICGSLRAGSTNAAVLRTAQRDVPAGVRATLYEGLGALPHFNPDEDGDLLDPAVTQLREGIAAADAVLFCTPEYAGALPGSFKNLLDWTVGGGETYGKPVAWINASGPAAPTGGTGAHDSLRTVLGYTGADIVEAACVRVPLERRDVGPDGHIADETARRDIAAALAALAAHVTRSRAERAAA
jgi:NAD(P)H-dependent FMN reductase